MTGPYTVITTMKNEGAFLIEWVAHYKALGFDHLAICTNDCADPTARMVRRLEQMGLARHHATRVWDVSGIQRSALKQIRRYPEVTGAEWIFVCDADEFLVVHVGDGSARALVAAARPGAEVICVPWRIFGPDGRIDYQDRPVTEQFTRARARPAPGERALAYPKSLFTNLPAVHRIGIHFPHPRADLGRPLRAELPGGIDNPVTDRPMFVQADYRVAQVNHYALRSVDSFLVKRDRGRVNHARETMDLPYWDRFDIQDEPCHAIRRYDAAAADWRARLMDDRRLARLHDESVAWHRARVAELRARPDHAPLLAGIAERLARRAATRPGPETAPPGC